MIGYDVFCWFRRLKLSCDWHAVSWRAESEPSWPRVDQTEHRTLYYHYLSTARSSPPIAQPIWVLLPLITETRAVLRCLRFSVRRFNNRATSLWPCSPCSPCRHISNYPNLSARVPSLDLGHHPALVSCARLSAPWILADWHPLGEIRVWRMVMFRGSSQGQGPSHANRPRGSWSTKTIRGRSCGRIVPCDPSSACIVPCQRTISYWVTHATTYVSPRYHE